MEDGLTWNKAESGEPVGKELSDSERDSESVPECSSFIGFGERM